MTNIVSVQRTAAPPRVPGVAMAVMAAVVFGLVAAVALTARSEPPPTIAEYAPQASRQITDAPDSLGSAAGIGAGGGGAADGGATTSTTAPPAATRDEDVIETQSVRRCIGDPPRQIEDPQSPPCVPYWKGDNGGATWKGVTRDEIRVAVANIPDDTGAMLFDPTILKAYETFFNRRFEFYGRRLNLLQYRPARHSATAVEMRNDAVKVDEQLGAFAAVMYSEQDGRQFAFYDALAERKIMGITTGLLGLGRADEAHLARFAPYQWDYTPSPDRMFRGYGEFICNTLAGKPPIYGGPFPPQWGEIKERVFAVVVDTSYKDTPPFDLKPMQEVMKRCNAPLHVIHWGFETQPTAVLARLQDLRVTDVMYTGQSGILGLRFMTEASAQNYYPEWLIWNLGYQDSDAAAQFYPRNQANHVLGLQVYNKTLRPEDTPYVWAVKEVDPAANPDGDQYQRLYSSLLVLASGIQAAGPQLTPSNFQRGLQATRFPNPGAGGPPYYQATVDFSNDHTMVQDMTMVWLSTTERSPLTQAPPAYCYVDLGKRYAPGQWPKRDAPFFQPPCR